MAISLERNSSREARAPSSRWVSRRGSSRNWKRSTRPAQGPGAPRPDRQLVEMEERLRAPAARHNYYANRYGIDVLTDTTERLSDVLAAPWSFRRFGPTSPPRLNHGLSWFMPDADSLGRLRAPAQEAPGVRRVRSEARSMRSSQRTSSRRTLETVRKISRRELTRFKVGLDGLRPPPRPWRDRRGHRRRLGGARPRIGGWLPPRTPGGSPPGRRAHCAIIAVGRDAALEPLPQWCDRAPTASP